MAEFLEQPLAVPAPTVLPAPIRPRRWLRRLRLLGLFLLAVALVSLATAAAFARYGGAYQLRPFALAVEVPGDPPVGAKLGRETERWRSRVVAQAPRGIYITIDTYNNRLRIWKSGELLREALCSTGSGVVLTDPRNGHQWIFDSPLGEQRILQKKKDPIWNKPDWAFIEEGYLPPKGGPDRYDDFSLGDYGLYMRDGYIIHGTIFKTLLGQRVTHGCIRLGDEDLEYAFHTVPLGARVYLY